MVLAIWLIGLFLIALILLRAAQAGFLSKYRLFYTYLTYVLGTSSFLLFIYFAKPTSYRQFYWITEFPGVALGCGIVWEIYSGGLGRYPGASRMARKALFVALAMVFSKVLVDTLNGSAGWPSGTLIVLERDLRAVQALVLVGFVGVISYYGIPLGRNLWGMFLGYGLFIGTNVLNLTLRALVGSSFQSAWVYLQQVSYNAMLFMWCFALWSYRPVPVSKTEPRIEHDYQALVLMTRKSLAQARAYVKRVARP